MNPWLPEEIFKTWTEAQRRLWQSLSAALPFQPSQIVTTAWREAYAQNLARWETAVQRSLEQETAWVEEWVRRVATTHGGGTPEMMALWTRQMEEVLQRWLHSQTQWWHDYFALLRRSGGGLSETAADRPDMSTAPPEVATASDPTPAGLPPEAAAPSPAPDLAPAAVGAPDDLKGIKGIGPILEQKLHACGVHSLRDLALLDEAKIAQIEAAIGFPGRIRREDWIGQAKTRCGL